MLEYHNKPDKIPGEEIPMKEKLMCQGAAMIEKFGPINSICDHLVGLHCYATDIKRQVMAHHYCSQINKDFRQCLLYDSDRLDAKLIGVEYIVSQKLFALLPEDEKKFWHSHVYEIKSGLLTIPNVPFTAEHIVMESVIGTYGKTIHFWQIDRGDLLPIGPPQVMMSPQNDNQVNWDLVKKRDELLKLNTQSIKENRDDIIIPLTDPSSDQWFKTGKGVNLEVTEKNLDLQ
jgi:hypothetical protein